MYINYQDDFSQMRPTQKDGRVGISRKKTLVKSSCVFCSVCNITIANADPNRQEDDTGSVRHKVCPRS